MGNKRGCWCGYDKYTPFSPYYIRCNNCNTLISTVVSPGSYYMGADDGSSLYGKDYWFQHMKDLGFPDISERARNDLSERNIFWLRQILKYKLPPAKTLELGCCHGGSVYLMKMAGFDATGSEMSEWICDFAQNTFNIPMLCGPIEEHDLPQGSFDMIVLMDVFEHLSDPVAVLEAIQKLLTVNGIIVIQTPCFSSPYKTHQEMKSSNDIFLEQLKENEHLYIFNQRSIESILNKTGFQHVLFEQPIFPYDMFVFAGKEPLAKVNHEAIAEELTKAPERRLVLSLLELYETYSLCEQDRIAKQEVIENMTIDRELYAGKMAEQAVMNCRNEILNSYCWKMTAPLRKFADLFKR